MNSSHPIPNKPLPMSRLSIRGNLDLEAVYYNVTLLCGKGGGIAKALSALWELAVEDPINGN
jgi:hypothetical protein